MNFDNHSTLKAYAGRTAGGRIEIDTRTVMHDAAPARARKYAVIVSDGKRANELSDDDTDHPSEIALDAAPEERIDYLRFFNGVPYEVGMRRYEEYMASREKRN